MVLSENFVPGEGPEPCPVMIIGEAPGEQEDKELKPFVGRAGKLLNEVLEDAGLPREKVYVTNVVKRRPPGNRRPTWEEWREAERDFYDEIHRVKPRFVLLLGNSALAALTLIPGRIMVNHGWISPEKSVFMNLAEVYATIHPSAALRNPAYKNLLKIDVETFAKRVLQFVQEDEHGRLVIEEKKQTIGETI